VLDPGSHLLSVDLNATQFRLGFASERPGPQETTVRIDLALTLTPTDAQVVPEPAAILLMGTGLAVATLKRRV
jgi:PEP-CTERM motif